MPDGATHLNLWKKNMPKAALIGAAFCVIHPAVGIGYALGYALGFFIDPDLDQVGLSSSEGRMMRYMGPLGILLVMLFLPYAYTMRFVGTKKGHRGTLTHSPMLSTLLRVAWLLVVPAGVMLWQGWSVPLWVAITIFGLYLGQCHADLVHISADFGWFDKRRRHGGKKKL